MDQEDGASLTKRVKTIDRRCSVWNVYDVDDGIFLFCIGSALGSGLRVTKMKCKSCRFGSQRKFRHESGCAKVLQVAGSVKLTENGEMQELTVQPQRYLEQRRKRTEESSESEYNESNLESLDSSEGNEPSADGNNELCDVHNSSVLKEEKS